jgi:hypothetical protein
MNEFRSDYEEVKRWALPLHHVADLLHPDVDKSSETVRFHMNHFLTWLDSTYTNPKDELMVKNLKNYTNGFWDGLFTCYDNPYLPRTNNDHERYFRQTKTRHRRMTGLRSWNEYILRSGEYVVFVDDAIRQKDIEQRLQSVSYEDFRRERKRWEERLTGTTKRRRFRRNPSKYLADVEKRYCALIGQS